MKHVTEKEDILYHVAAAGVVSVLTFPLWRATAIAQSGFHVKGSSSIKQYIVAVSQPPFRGVTATMLGMTWARGAVFFGSDYGRQLLENHGIHGTAAHTLPPLFASTVVQLIYMPLVRAAVTIQNPQNEIPNVRQAIAWIYRTRGVLALWHGVSAGVLKAIPKYVSAVVVKNFMEDILPMPDCEDKNLNYLRVAVKSGTAGVASAVVINPLSVLRNEMFKTDLPLIGALQKLWKEEGWRFAIRGVGSSMIAVAVPFTLTLFLSDMMLTKKYTHRETAANKSLGRS